MSTEPDAPRTKKMQAAIDAYRNTDKSILAICLEHGVSSGGLGRHVKRLGLNRMPYPRRRGTSPWRGMTGEDHPCWKGGLHINRDGYLMRYAPEHPYPRNRKRGQILEHVRLMELHLGRHIEPHEIVHHKDENRLNNAEDNLELMTNGEHSGLHRRLEKERGILRRFPDLWRDVQDTMFPRETVA